MKALGIALLLFLGVLLVVGFVQHTEGSENGVQPVATLGPEGCEPDRDAIQVALDAYHDKYGKWPTDDGRPGDIEWSKLVPDFLPYIPHTDTRCDWQVNSNPEGHVCLWQRC